MAAQPDDVERQLQAKIDDLNSVIDAYEQGAIGSDANGELARQRKLSIDAYQGKNIEPAPEGRSQVVDWTVFEVIQWILPSLTRIFASGDDVVEFEPFGPEDEDAAEQESEYLNYLVTQKGNWFLTCVKWFQDALSTKNAYCWATMEERLATEVETYERQSEEQVALILDDDVELVGSREYVDEEAEPEVVLNELGQPTPQPAIVYDIQTRRTKAKKRLKFRVLPPERCKVDENCPDFTLNECNYFEFWDNPTISEIRADGYDVEDDAGEDGDWDTEEDTARDEILAIDLHRQGTNPDKSLRRVKRRFIWVRHDFDDDGIAEMLHVIRIGNDVIEMDEVSQIPVSSIVPFLNAHRHPGMSVSDLVFDIQRIKTDILRQGLDNLRFSNNPREFFSEKVNAKALMLSRPGAKIEVKTKNPDVAGHVYTSTIPFVFPQAQEGLRHMDTVTEARVGVNRIFQGIDESNINDHDRVGQLSTMAAQRVEQIARMFGYGIERLFKIAHELIIKSGHQAETIKLRGEWVEFDPKNWKTGRDMRIVAPYSAGNKDSLLMRLNLIRGIHSEAASAGHPMVQLDDSYQLALDMAKAADVPGDKYFTDPEQIPPQEPPPDYTAEALRIEDDKVQADLAKTESNNRVKLATVEMQERVDKYKADLQAEVDLLIAQFQQSGKIDIEKFKAGNQPPPVDLEKPSKALAEAAENMSKESNKALGEAIEKLSAAVAEINADKEIVRDADGNITGARKVRG